MRATCGLFVLALFACSDGSESSSGFDNVCRVDNEYGYAELSWDEDVTSRFVELTRSVAGQDLLVAQCTQLDTSLPPACSVDVDTYCPTPDPNDGGRSVPCTSTWVFVVTGGHLIIEFADVDGLSEVGKCGTRG